MPHHKRILCVEDDPDVCAMISSLLDLLGYRVVNAPTMSEALARVRGEEFDLCLIDNWLPGGSGIELCRTIRADGIQTPIIFYSGAAYDEDRREALAAGANAYLIKPADLDKLVETVTRFCG